MRGAHEEWESPVHDNGVVAFAHCGHTEMLRIHGAKRPEKKNLEVMQVGTPRSRVLAEFGQPVSTEIRDGKKVDVFSFVQGYSKPAKAGRAALHATTDVLTSGTSEIVGTPTEVVLSGSKVAYEITHDENDRVELPAGL